MIRDINDFSDGMVVGNLSSIVVKSSDGTISVLLYDRRLIYEIVPRNEPIEIHSSTTFTNVPKIKNLSNVYSILIQRKSMVGKV